MSPADSPAAAASLGQKHETEKEESRREGGQQGHGMAEESGEGCVQERAGEQWQLSMCRLGDPEKRKLHDTVEQGDT